MDEIKLLWESLNRNRKETDILIRDLNHRINILENDVDELKEELVKSNVMIDSVENRLIISENDIDGLEHETNQINVHLNAHLNNITTKKVSLDTSVFPVEEFDYSNNDNIIDKYLNR